MNLADRPGIFDLSVLIPLLLGSITLPHTSAALANPNSHPADARSGGLHAAFPSTLPGAVGLAPPQRNEQFRQSFVSGLFLPCDW